MQFEVSFFSKTGNVLSMPEKKLGIGYFMAVRGRLMQKDFPFSGFVSDIPVLSRKSYTVKIPGEKVLENTRLHAFFNETRTRSVEILPDSLNLYAKISQRFECDSKTGFFNKTWFVWEVDEALLISDWLNCTCPIFWDFVTNDNDQDDEPEQE